MTLRILFYMKIKQGINSLFIYSQKGWFLVVFELSGLLSIIYAILQHYLYSEQTTVIFLLAFIILLGSSYSSAEKYLSCAENRLDLLSGIKAKHIIWVIYGQVLGKNLSVVSLFPLILIALSGTISLGMTLLTLLIFPFSAALIACSFNILINRYMKRIGGLFYLLFVLLWGGGTAFIFVFLLASHNLSFTTLNKNAAMFIIFLLGVIAAAILLFSSNLSEQWKETYLLNDSQNYRNKWPFVRFKLLSKLFLNSFIVKEWFLLWRNSITQIRFVAWVALIIICIYTPLKSYLHDPNLFLVITMIVWLFCFGELPATAWQTEGLQKSFYWLSGFKPSRLIAAKIVTFLPLMIFGVLTPVFLGFSIHLSFDVILQRSGLISLLVLAAIIIALAIACFGHNSTQQTIDNPIFEQVPLTLSSISAVCIEFLFCCIVFLPFTWILILSLIIPIISLIGQALWLSRIYY